MLLINLTRYLNPKEIRAELLTPILKFVFSSIYNFSVSLFIIMSFFIFYVNEKQRWDESRGCLEEVIKHMEELNKKIGGG